MLQAVVKLRLRSTRTDASSYPLGTPEGHQDSPLNARAPPWATPATTGVKPELSTTTTGWCSSDGCI